MTSEQVLQHEISNYLILADQLKALYQDIDDETLQDTLEGISDVLRRARPGRHHWIARHQHPGATRGAAADGRRRYCRQTPQAQPAGS